MDLFNEIKQMIVERFSVDDTDVVADANLQDDLGADSLAILYLAEAIGKKYGIELVGDDLVEIENVGELVELVESRIAEK